MSHVLFFVCLLFLYPPAYDFELRMEDEKQEINSLWPNCTLCNLFSVLLCFNLVINYPMIIISRLNQYRKNA